MTEPLIRGGGDGLAVFQSRRKKRRERETAAAILDEQERPRRTAPGSFRPFQSKNFKFQTYNYSTYVGFNVRTICVYIDVFKYFELQKG